MGNNVTASLPIMGILGVVFVTLKLCNVIAWSWWWVTAPFWAPWVFVGLLLILAIGVAIIKE